MIRTIALCAAGLALASCGPMRGAQQIVEEAALDVQAQMEAVSAQVAVADTVEAYLSAQEGFSGVVLVGDAQARALYAGAFGTADEASATPMRVDQTWRWASVTKQLIGVLVMQAVEDGDLTLDATIAQAWPAFSGPSADQVTVEMLLRHVSGLPDPDALSSRDYDAAGRGFDAADFCAGAPIAEPATTFEYNNCDYYVLGQILEEATGVAWHELLRQRVFEPAGMTGAGVVLPYDQPPAMVSGYVRQSVPETPIDLALFGAAGAAYGPPMDLIRFNAALMSGVVLGEEALETLWAGEPRLGYVALGAWSFSATLKGCDGPVTLIERRGLIRGVKVRNIIAPQSGRSLVAFVNRGDFAFGEIWMGEGFSYDLASRAFCVGLFDQA